MTMLRRILEEIGNAEGTLTLGELARRMGTPVSALTPMIRTLEAAGLLGADTETGGSCPAQCRTTCNPTSCPLTVSLPAPLEVRRV